MTYEEVNTLPGTTLVEFYATWCPHCRRMMPVVEDARKQIGHRARVCRFDIDRHPASAEKAGAESVPTFIVYRDGAELWRHVGETTAAALVAATLS